MAKGVMPQASQNGEAPGRQLLANGSILREVTSGDGICEQRPRLRREGRRLGGLRVWRRDRAVGKVEQHQIRHSSFGRPKTNCRRRHDAGLGLRGASVR